MPIPFMLIGKLAVLAAPIVIKETNKLMYISKQEKHIKELENEIINKKFEIGNHCYEKYGNCNHIIDKTLAEKLSSISDKIKEIAEIEENISEILSRYSETEKTQTELTETEEEQQEQEIEEIKEKTWDIKDYPSRDIERAKKMLQDGEPAEKVASWMDLPLEIVKTLV